VAGDQFTYTSAATPTPTTTPVAHPQHVIDFDGDGKTDYTVIRDNGAGAPVTWFTLMNDGTGSNIKVQDWGLDTDQFTPADFDGDGKTDLAIWRQPSNGGSGTFWILNSLDGTVTVTPWGTESDDPSVVRDYDGDGKADVAVYRKDFTADTGTWFYSTSSGPLKGTVITFAWGRASDSPYTGDFNGDGKADFAIDRPTDLNDPNSAAEVWVHYGDGANNAAGPSADKIDRWGLFSDLFVPGDFDGDGKTDYAIVRSAGGQLEWWVRWSTDNSVHVARWGLDTDIIAQGDYDGDGKTDLAVWRPNDDGQYAAFYALSSKTGAPIFRAWGTALPNTDVPAAGYDIEYF